MVWSIFIGILLIILGFLVRKYKLTWMLSGSRKIKEGEYDVEGITKYIGSELIIIGLVLIFFTFIDNAIGLDNFDLIVFVVVTVVIVIHMFGTKRFKLKK